jgi:hypothetical protein
MLPTFQRAASESPISLASVSALLAGTSACIMRNDSRALPAQLANFGPSNSKQPLTEPHILTNMPHAHNSMPSICVGDGDSWRLHRS